MARSEARLQFGLWREGLEGYSANAKLLYAVLLTEDTVNFCGKGAIRVAKWARDASLPLVDTEKALDELRAGDPREAPVVIDESTDEVLVRTLIRHDRVAEQPWVLKAALKDALAVKSSLFKWVLANELRKLPPKPPDGVSKRGVKIVYPDPHGCAAALEACAHAKPSETLFEGFEQASDSLPEAFEKKGFGKAPTCALEGEGEGEVVTSRQGDGCVSPNAAASGERASKPSDLEARFGEFWAVYPRKIEKQGALKAWREVRRKGAEPGRIIAGAARYARLNAGEDPKFVKYPATWLRAGGFDDEPEPPRVASRPALPDDPDAAFDDLRRRGAAVSAARIAGISPPVIESKPPSDPTDPREWDRQRRVEWIDLHKPEIHDALSRRVR